MKLTPDQVLTTCKGDNEIAAFVHTLLDTIDQQAVRIQHLEQRVHDLERQLGMNSTNSSKPPSSDGLRKPVNLRTPGGKKGAPQGHRGTTLCRVDHPDEVIVHSLDACPDCGGALSEIAGEAEEKRQVFDLPSPRMEITEHRAKKTCCSQCRRVQPAPFPAHVAAPVQYGSGMAA